MAPSKRRRESFISFYFLFPSLRLLSAKILFVGCYLTILKIYYFFVCIINLCILLPFGVAFLFAGVYPLIFLSEKLRSIKSSRSHLVENQIVFVLFSGIGRVWNPRLERIPFRPLQILYHVLVFSVADERLRPVLCLLLDREPLLFFSF